MKQQNSRMIAEVNKLIGNTLIKSEGIYLPDIGSLSVVTTPPSAAEDGSETAPARKVEMTTEARHRAITEIISERGNCTPQQASQIYRKWVEVVSMSDNKLIIHEVGEIRDGVFSSTPSFEERLNPVVIKRVESKPAAEPTEQEQTEVKEVKKVKVDIVDDSVEPENEGIKRWEERKETISKKAVKPTATKKYSTATKSVAIAIIAAVAVAAGIFMLGSADETNEVQVTEQVAEVITEQPQPIEPQETTPQPTEVAAATTPIVETKPKAKPNEANMTPEEILEARFNAGRNNLDKPYKVVFGAYSSAQNVARAITIAEKRAGGEVSCTVYRHGKSYLVSLYDTKSEAEARAFMKRHREVMREPLWLHKR